MIMFIDLRPQGMAGSLGTGHIIDRNQCTRTNWVCEPMAGQVFPGNRGQGRPSLQEVNGDGYRSHLPVTFTWASPDPRGHQADPTDRHCRACKGRQWGKSITSGTWYMLLNTPVYEEANSNSWELKVEEKPTTKKLVADLSCTVLQPQTLTIFISMLWTWLFFFLFSSNLQHKVPPINPQALAGICLVRLLCRSAINSNWYKGTGWGE